MKTVQTTAESINTVLKVCEPVMLRIALFLILTFELYRFLHFVIR